MLTIEHPLTGEKLQIANKDFSNKMTWEEAMDACRQLGSGWRLPTIEELQGIYEQLHENGLGGFASAWYWSSSENDSGGAWVRVFDVGDQVDVSKDGTGYVRAVRAI